MDRTEIIRAYQEGRISRRSFIRGMMHLGVNPINAVALADALEPTPRFEAHPSGTEEAGEGEEG